MEWIKNLSKIQIIILILISGITSLIAIIGLESTDVDYYVTAAISRAFFLAIFLLVLTSPFLYIFRKKEKVEKPNTETKISNGWKRFFVIVIILLTLGVMIGVTKSLNNKLIPNRVQVASNNCPQIPIDNPEVQKMHVLFDPLKPPDGTEFYKKAPDSSFIEGYFEDYPDKAIWTEESFDVDADGSTERILTASIAMNHTPHVLKIVKEGYVIFEYEGAGVSVEKISSGNGFILWETTDWNEDIKKVTRYEYTPSGSLSLGGFTPLWYQESKNCNIN